MPKVFTSKSQQKGELGEKIACKYLISKGFSILDRNYTVFQGEIDIIAMYSDTVVFVEVKSLFTVVENKREDGVKGRIVPHETQNNVTRGTFQGENTHIISQDLPNEYKRHEMNIRPEDNMHPRKLQKLYRTIEIYLSDKDVLKNKEWRIDLLCVFIDIHSKRTRVIHYENVNI